MMTLKLQKHRTGKRKYFYSVIIISTKSKPLSGKFVEKIGYYHPNPDQ
jgi:ribosomal protein S16